MAKKRVVGEWMEIHSGCGKLTTEKCPEVECDGSIVYNGNFFCEHWGNTCDWALPHPQSLHRDQLLAWKLGGYYEKPRYAGDDLGAIIKTEPKKGSK